MVSEERDTLGVSEEVSPIATYIIKKKKKAVS